MTTTQAALGISALVFTCIAFVMIIVLFFLQGAGGVSNWVGITAGALVALGLLLTEIGLVAPYNESYINEDDEN
jgi:hypothetical protein